MHIKHSSQCLVHSELQINRSRCLYVHQTLCLPSSAPTLFTICCQNDFLICRTVCIITCLEPCHGSSVPRQANQIFFKDFSLLLPLFFTHLSTSSCILLCTLITPLIHLANSSSSLLKLDLLLEMPLQQKVV